MYKRVPKQTKNAVLEKVKSGEKVSDVAQQYGISVKTVYTWLRRDTGEDVISVIKYNKLRRENEELKRLIGELTLNMSLGKKN
jgi:transposase-like protein